LRVSIYFSPLSLNKKEKTWSNFMVHKNIFLGDCEMRGILEAILEFEAG
jgi:hypothetical protein